MGQARLKLLFLCTGNSCRSQMAEGWARALKGDSVDAYSAGIEPRGLDPLAVRVMAEAGVDISAQRSKPGAVPTLVVGMLHLSHGDASVATAPVKSGATTHEDRY